MRCNIDINQIILDLVMRIGKPTIVRRAPREVLFRLHKPINNELNNVLGCFLPC